MFGGTALVAAPEPALARALGIVSPGCEGCHGGGEGMAEVSMTASPTSFALGDSVTMTVTIRSPGARVGGMYLLPPAGTLRVLPGEGLVANRGLAHDHPKPAESGTITFRFGWLVPATPGVGTFEVFALAGNGDNTSGGDTPGSKLFQWAFGCEGRKVFWDGDGDGFGIPDETRLVCGNAAPPSGYADRVGDCLDFDQSIHPGAIEICNLKDDNCDGAIDENAPPVMSWPDEDGDGYYGSKEGTPRTTCGGMPGYASVGGDCGPRDAAIHPGMKEVCNLKDDDCDGSIDELVRPRCGVGSCRREALSCNATDCVPGVPAAEVCNYLDDDCDGEVDEEAFCDRGLVCIRGACVSPGEPQDGGGTQDPPRGGGAGDAPTGSSTGGGVVATGGASAAGCGCTFGGETVHGAAGAAGAAGETVLLLVLATMWVARPRRHNRKSR
ncbi:MAG: putative metal-binding motif-containing protein [Polyangia bacterium]